MRMLIVAVGMCIACQTVQSQDTYPSTDKISALPANFLHKVNSRISSLESKLDKHAAKYLSRLKKQEARLKRKLIREDSLKAAAFFGKSEQVYRQLQQRLQKITSENQYIPGLDTLFTSLSFLQHNPQLLTHYKNGKGKLLNSISKLNELKKGFGQAEEINNFLKERKRLLRQLLEQPGLANELKKFNKQAYYFNEQINEYKNMLNDHRKIESKAIDLLCKSSLFKDFFKRNSFLGGLFPSGSNSPGSAGNQAGFAGLQTRQQLRTFIQQSVAGASVCMPPLQRNIQDAQSQLNDLRSKINELAGSNGTNTELPDFKPNSQKVKSFWKRLEYGTSFQSQKANGFLPVTADIGFTAGYKLNDKSIVGIGAGYKLGLGKGGWKNIKLSSQGMNLRSFIDWKIKPGLLVSGGYELNYRPGLQGFAVLDQGQLLRAEVWQPSGLIGLSKTIDLKTKFFKKTKFQLLWDFLSYRQKPQTQPLVFRVGYNF